MTLSQIVELTKLSGRTKYPAAYQVASTVEAHFARQIQDAIRAGEDGLATIPDANSIASIVDATFWASFRPEEGRFPKISLAYLPPEQADQPLIFEHALCHNTAVRTSVTAG